MTPTQNATVLPDPVRELATMSLPSMATGIHSRWIGVGTVRLRLPRDRRSWRERVQLGRVEKVAAEAELETFVWEVKYAFAAAASAAAAGSADGEVAWTCRLTDVSSSSSSEPESSSSIPASAAKPVGASD